MQSSPFLIEFVQSFLPQISTLALAWLGRELYRTNKQIRVNEQTAMENREILKQVASVVEEEHDVKGVSP